MRPQSERNGTSSTDGLHHWHLLPRRDAIESCSSCEGAEATACYAYFGCDKRRVDRWFSIVAKLEQSLVMPGARVHWPPNLPAHLMHFHLSSTCLSMAAVTCP